MKRKNGFTTIELIIVIAIIAILAAVLTPTFSNIIQKSYDSSALQRAKHALVSVAAEDSQWGSAEYFFLVTEHEKDYIFAIDSADDTDKLHEVPAKPGTAQLVSGIDDLDNLDIAAYKLPHS